MKETRINKETISHILIRDTCRESANGVEYVWMEPEYFSWFWIFKTEKYPAGFYRNKKREWIINDVPKVVDDVSEYVKDNCIWTKPRVSLYVGNVLIKNLYFDTVDKAKKYCDENFPNVDVCI